MTPRPPTRQAGPRDDGSAIVIALLATMLIAALGQGLVLLADTEQAIAANAHAGTEALYAADAGIACVVSELRRTTAWTGVLAGSLSSAFVDGTRTPRGPSGEIIDLNALTSALQASAAATDPWGADNPSWRLYAYGPLASFTGSPRDRAYVAVWVADDPADGDGNPVVDSNRVLTLLATGFGPSRSVRRIQATVGAPAGGVQSRPRVVSWREVR